MYNPLTGNDITFKRTIGKYDQGKPGPFLVVLAGIHGNEPSGVLGAESVFRHLEQGSIPFHGTLLGIAGNLRALRAGVRFIDRDLNRMWSFDRVERLKEATELESPEEEEMLDIVRTIDEHLKPESRRFFLDCHTTSCESVPYISCLPRPECIELASNFPVHSIIGGSDRLQGITDEYFVDRGFTGFTYEAGQHASLASLEAQQAAIWVTLQQIGCIDEVPNQLWEQLAKTQFDGPKSFQVEYIHHVNTDSAFQMVPGYFNFQRIRPGELLAWEQDDPVRSQWDARIFLPLYQPLGDDGFSIVVER